MKVPLLIFVFLSTMLSANAQNSRLWQNISVSAPQLPGARSSADTISYGSEDQPSPRTDAVTWPNPQGGVWIYGGVGYDETRQWGVFSDLWNYEPASNKWTHLWGERNKISKSDIETPEFPLPRKEAGAWVDSNGSLWMFGGRQLGDLYHLDDLWKFDTKTQAWSKYSGKGKFNEKSERGPIKLSSKTNTPGSRSLMSNWTDADGNLWLFGGLAYTPGQDVVAEFYSDLWKFDVKKGAWEWVSGKDKPNQSHQYNFKDPASKENLPMPRAAAANWYDPLENRLFLYGGMGFDSSATIAGGLSDMWVYTVGKDRWERIAGDSKINTDNNIYNPVSEDKGNQPGWRISSMVWNGPDNKLYLAGGHSTFTAEQIYIEKNVWAFSPKSGLWQVLPQTDISVSGSGSPFKDAKGDLFIFGGKEFDREKLITRPSNTIFKLSF